MFGSLLLPARLSDLGQVIVPSPPSILCLSISCAKMCTLWDTVGHWRVLPRLTLSSSFSLNPAVLLWPEQRAQGWSALLLAVQLGSVAAFSEPVSLFITSGCKDVAERMQPRAFPEAV